MMSLPLAPRPRASISSVIELQSKPKAHILHQLKDAGIGQGLDRIVFPEGGNTGKKPPLAVCRSRGYRPRRRCEKVYRNAQ